jgi:hypothetical protein
MMKLYHVRRSRFLDELQLLRDAEVHHNDVIAIFDGEEDERMSLVRQIPKKLPPVVPPQEKSITLEDVERWEIEAGKRKEEERKREREEAAIRVRENVWVSGSLFLLFVIAVISMLILAARSAPWWSFPVIVIATPLIVSIIGAFTLRSDEKLSQLNFLELVRISFSQLPLLRYFWTKPSSTKKKSK